MVAIDGRVLMRTRRTGMVWLVLVATLLAGPVWADDPWVRTSPEGMRKIQLYFFWAETCPHCRKAKPFIENLAGAHDWLEVHSYEVNDTPEHTALFIELSQKLGRTRLGVPAFAFCEQMTVGYAGEATEQSLLAALKTCKDRLLGESTGTQPGVEKAPAVDPTPPPAVTVPFLGEVEASRFSLPVFTLIIAGLDAFNPCAFFVLLLLLSILVSARSRWRIALVGGVFVFFSGFIYFLFMAAWLNLFLYLGELRVVTVIAALTALVVSAINIKDYFFFGEGVTLSIPESAKPGLFQRIRGLVAAARWPSLLAGTVVLAVVANTYELLCTAGFPMVFARVLTLHDLSTAGYYLYLVLYNVIYIIPLAVIVTLFAVTLGSRKLSEKEGRILKLVSGLMMLELGLVLLFAPELMTRLGTAILLVAGAVLATALIVLYGNRKHPTASP